jgi:DNA-binding NarL/FixJ family response regulator
MRPSSGIRLRLASVTNLKATVWKREAMRKGIGVLLADDADTIRSFVTLMLGTQPEIHIVGEAKTFAETLEMTATLRPAVVLMDIHMPGERDFTANLHQGRASQFRKTRSGNVVME